MAVAGQDVRAALAGRQPEQAAPLDGAILWQRGYDNDSSFISNAFSIRRAVSLTRQASLLQES